MWETLNPFRLPVHPPFVHFPVAMLTLVWGMLVLRYATGDIRWDARARLMHLIGVASLPIVLATAIIDTRGFRFVTDARWDAALIWHALAGGVVAAVVFAHFLWRRRYAAEQLTGRLAVMDLTLASVAFWTLLAATLLAGEMVYGT
jgi:uncharacterized membrane protein